MKLSHKIAIFFTIVFTLLLVIFFSLTIMFDDAKQSELIQKNRFSFYQKVIRHKQNSELFSEVIITYLNTKDENFKSKVDEVLSAKDFAQGDIKACRNRILKNLDYEVAPNFTKPEIRQIEAFFNKLGISEKDFFDIFKAKSFTKSIVELEFESIQAVRGYFKDENGLYTIQKPSNKEYALQILLSDEYKNLKSDLRENVNETFKYIDRSLLAYILKLQKEESDAYEFILYVSGILLIVIVVSYFNFRRDIVKPLDQLNYWIKQMKANELEIKQVSFPKDEIGVVMNSFYKMADTIRKDMEELERLSTTDPLTKLKNRVTLDKSLEQAFYSFKRYETDCSIIIMDIDYFKSVNDTYGHNIGDMVLKEIALILKTEVRLTDVLGRWGGEEFLIICNNTKLEGATLLAEKLRRKIEAYDFKKVGKKTASFGVSSIDKNMIIEEVLDKADKALYAAKENGRNQVVVK